MILIRKTNKFKFSIKQTNFYTIYHIFYFEILVLRKHSSLNLHKFEKSFRYLTHKTVEDIMYLRRKGDNYENEVSKRRKIRKAAQYGNENKKE